MILSTFQSPVHSVFFWCLLLSTTLLYAVLLLRLVMRPLSASVGKILRALLGIELVFLAASVLAYYVSSRTWERLLSSDFEQNPATLFSTVQLVAVAVVAMYGSSMTQIRPSLRAFWGLFAAVFVLLALDEAHQGHETMTVLIGNAGVVRFPWGFPVVYAIGAVVFVSTSALALRLYIQRDGLLVFRLLAGLAVSAFAGIGLEVVYLLSGYNPLCRPGLLELGCHRLTIFEEFYEMGGVTMILVGLLAHLEAGISKSHWKKLLIAAGFSSLIAGIITVGIWVFT